MNSKCSTIMNLGMASWKSLKLHMSYALCYHRKIDNLKLHIEKLELRRIHNQEKVDLAIKGGEIIHGEVQQWLINCDTTHEDMRRLVDSMAGAKCCSGLLPDLCLRYKLGKKADKKMAAIETLLSEGNFDKVSHSPPPPINGLASTQPTEDRPSRESTIGKILDALRDDNVHIIGVYGIAGVGKTTLVKEAAMRAKEEGLIDEMVIVTVSQNLGVKRLQDELAEKLGLKFDEESESATASKLSARLKDLNNILIILDDPRDRLDLNNVG